MSTCDLSKDQKNKRRKWDPENMKKAVEAVKNKKMGYLKAHKIFHVPKSTLEDYVKNKDGKSVDELLNRNLGRRTVLSEYLETLLIEYLLDMEKRFYGLRASDVRRLAFQLAIQNNIKHPFKGSSAGKKWLKLFMRRHPELSLRTPQSISSARVKGFTRENVDAFFDIYEKELSKVGFSPQKIFNVDETGISIVQHKMSKVIGRKGKKQIASISSAERGTLITLVTCMSAAGQYIPPMFVFPRKNMKPELMNGTPPGSISTCHISGWIQGDAFTKWLNHFIGITKPSVENPVILILDGHYSHSRNLDVINIGREHGVIIICLPPHSTHKMQPLDVAFMSPFKTFYAQEIETWLRTNASTQRVVTAYQIGELVGKAYGRAAAIQNAINGFRKTGLFPCDRNAFEEYEFAIESGTKDAETTDNEIETEKEKENKLTEANILTQSPSDRFREEKRHSFNNYRSSSLSMKPTDISPLPSLKKRKHQSEDAGKERKKGKAALGTGSPFKKQLVESLKKNSKNENPNLQEKAQPSTSGKCKTPSRTSKQGKKQLTVEK